VVIDPWFEFLLSGDFSAYNIDNDLRWNSLTDLTRDYHKILVRDAKEAQATLDKYGSEGRIFLISPLVYLWTRQVALDNERIIVIDGSPRWASGGKGVSWSDRGDAMEKAGSWAGQLVAGRENTVVAGIISGTIPMEETGFARFKAGFLKEAPEETLLVLPVNTAPESAADNLIRITEGKKVALWFLFAGTADPAVLAIIEGRGGPFLVEEGGAYLKTGSKPATINADRPLMIRTALAMVREGRFGEAAAVPARFSPVKIKKTEIREEK
jgi:hypothetical protein